MGKKKKKWSQSSLKKVPKIAKPSDVWSDPYPHAKPAVAAPAKVTISPEQLRVEREAYCEDMMESFVAYFEQQPGNLFFAGTSSFPILTNVYKEGSKEATPEQVKDFIAKVREGWGNYLKYVLHTAGAFFIFGDAWIHREAPVMASGLNVWQVEKHTVAAGFLCIDSDGKPRSTGESISIGKKCHPHHFDSDYINSVVDAFVKRAELEQA